MPLTIVLGRGDERWDEEREIFVYPKAQEVKLEHSLVSISKWEAKWHIPYLADKPEKTDEQIKDYIKCMTLTQNVDPTLYDNLSNEELIEIRDYINDSQTATWFNERGNGPSGPRSTEVITSELIYYWMVALQIPVEFQKWHVNRLLTLIRVCNVKNQPQKKMPSSEVLSQQAALNKARRKALNSKG